MRTRCVSLLLCLAPLAATAAEVPASDAPKPNCFDVEVNGYRTPSYDCLGQQLAPRTPGPHDNPALASEQIVKLPPNQLGLANPAATSNRMGSNFGKSAFPQRPPAKPYSSPLPGK